MHQARHDKQLCIPIDVLTRGVPRPQQYPVASSVASFPDVQLPSLTSELLECPFATFH